MSKLNPHLFKNLLDLANCTKGFSFKLWNKVTLNLNPVPIRKVLHLQRSANVISCICDLQENTENVTFNSSATALYYLLDYFAPPCILLHFLSACMCISSVLAPYFEHLLWFAVKQLSRMLICWFEFHLLSSESFLFYNNGWCPTLVSCVKWQVKNRWSRCKH